MVEENPRDVGHEMDGLSIVYGDESLPRLYENSRVSSDQLPGQPGKLKPKILHSVFNFVEEVEMTSCLFMHTCRNC